MSYQVKLDVFEGPFDLLLHLIAKREVDVYEVSLASITEEYLAHLEAMAEFDLEIATEFLVVAAALLEIKAGRLMPQPPGDEEDLDAFRSRDLLIARLIEYRAFKEAAALLRDMLDANAGFLAREAGPGPEFADLCPDLLPRVSPERLRDLAVAALTPRPLQETLDLSHLAPIRVSVADAVAAVWRILKGRPRASFRELSRDCSAPIEVIVRFLAVLELVKRGEADVRQPEAFGEIEVALLDGGGESPPVLAVDEYEGTPEPPATGPGAVDATGPGAVDATGPGAVDATGPGAVDATGPVDATGGEDRTPVPVPDDAPPGPDEASPGREGGGADRG